MWRWLLAAIAVVVASILIVVLSESSPAPDSTKATETPEPPPEPPPDLPTRQPDSVRVSQPKHDQFSAPEGLDLATVLKDAQKREHWEKELEVKCKRLVVDRKLDAARDCFELLMALNPNNPKVYLGLGIVAASQGKRTEAYHLYQKYLELDSDGPRARQVEQALDAYDRYMVADSVPSSQANQKVLNTGIRGAQRLYEEAYVIKHSTPEIALQKLKLAIKLLPEDHLYMSKAKRLKKLIESGAFEQPVKK